MATSDDCLYELLKLANTRGDMSHEVRDLLFAAIIQARREQSSRISRQLREQANNVA